VAVMGQISNLEKLLNENSQNFIKTNGDISINQKLINTKAECIANNNKKVDIYNKDNTANREKAYQIYEKIKAIYNQ